jgi:hypothetical protein
MATTLPQVPQKIRGPSCAFAQQDDPDDLSTHGAPKCMVRTVVCATTFADLWDFWKAVVRKIRSIGWPRIASDPDGPVRRNTKAPRSRFVLDRCFGAKDGRLLNGQVLAASVWKLVSSNVRASGILKIRSAPWHLFHLQPPCFDGFFLFRPLL